MKLVEFLAAGVNGAANGSATFVLRGTASSAAAVLWNDFEGTAQPGTNIITLDANGAAEIYTDAYVDVTLKTSAGATLRTVTVGNTATTTEVISDSFTGVDYSGSPTAVNEPITLAAVLNKWDDSAGTDDWKVSIGGVATNLSSAFAALAGLFFNVKDPAYGALGDGVTDDTTAIGLAIAAAASAGGGIVFFPATTTFYSFTQLSISAANITLMGSSPTGSLLKSATTAGVAVSFTDNTANRWKKIINLGIQGTGANANALLALEETQNVFIDGCEFEASTYTGNVITRASAAGKSFIIIENSRITIGASSDSAVRNLSGDGQTFWSINNTKFIIPASFGASVVLGPNFHINTCVFDASAQVTGGYNMILPGSNDTANKYLGLVSGCEFIDGNSGGFVFSLASIASGSDFSEENNKFTGFTAPTAVTGAGKIYDISHNAADAYNVHLGSRSGRTIELTLSSTGTSILSAITSYENLFINYTGAGNATLQMPIATMTNGSMATIVLQQNDASARDIVIDCGESVQTYGTAADGGGVTTNADITAAATANAERVIFNVTFSHFGSGAPLAFINGVVAD